MISRIGHRWCRGLEASVHQFGPFGFVGQAAAISALIITPLTDSTNVLSRVPNLRTPNT